MCYSNKKGEIMEKFKALDIKYLSQDTPVAFCDGTKIYNKLKKEFITHKQGIFIYAPSGVGKTWYVKRQKEPHFIDGDYLWGLCGALPSGAWWLNADEDIDRYERRADVITEQAKKLGFYIMGASRISVIPDAIVLPPLETHLKYIKERESHYDGGLKSDNIEAIKSSRERTLKAKGPNTLVFESVQEACEYFIQKEKE